MSYWYLATPFTNYPGGAHAAWRLACQENHRLIRAGIPVYSPIAHTAGMELDENGQFNGSLDAEAWQAWMNFAHVMMKDAIGLIMLRADGWQNSKGMAQEYDTFVSADKLILWMDPGEIPFELMEEHTVV